MYLGIGVRYFRSDPPIDRSIGKRANTTRTPRAMGVLRIPNVLRERLFAKVPKPRAGCHVIRFGQSLRARDSFVCPVGQLAS